MKKVRVITLLLARHKIYHANDTKLCTSVFLIFLFLISYHNIVASYFGFLQAFYPSVTFLSLRENNAPRPLLFIMGDKASSVYFSEEAYAKAAEPKELYIIKDALHTDLYDNPVFMKDSIQKLKDFFDKNL